MTRRKIMLALTVIGSLVLALENQAWSDEKPGKRKSLAQDQIEMAAAKVTRIQDCLWRARERITRVSWTPFIESAQRMGSTA